MEQHRWNSESAALTTVITASEGRVSFNSFGPISQAMLYLSLRTGLWAEICQNIPLNSIVLAVGSEI